VGVCPERALAVINGRVKVDRLRCNTCGDCVPACPQDALKIFGRQMTVGEVMEEVRRDELFYRNSEGGVTISGGEVLTQADFAAEVLRQCVESGIHTAIESCGHAPRHQLDKILPYLDLALYDIKHMTPQIHKRFTGVSNELVLENARYIAARGVALVVRIPIIPGFNDDEANIRATCRFAASMNGNVQQIDLLPYHRFGMGKWAMLDRPYTMAHLQPPTRELIERLQAIICAFGFACSVGG
jgi:pyruvate formate lyase activating enzyme